MNIQEAFDVVCYEAKERESWFVSLYLKTPYYGGPEEGGWWGEDCKLVKSQEFSNETAAEDAYSKIQETIDKENEELKKEFENQCLKEMKWLDKRGLDSDFLPEVNGEEKYIVVIEQKKGELESQGSRHYE